MFSIYNHQYNLNLNSTSLYILQIFQFRNRKSNSYLYYIKQLFYIRLYSLLIRFLLKEIKLYLKKKNIKILSFLPFVTLYQNNSRDIKIKLEYTKFFNSLFFKQFIYK